MADPFEGLNENMALAEIEAAEALLETAAEMIRQHNFERAYSELNQVRQDLNATMAKVLDEKHNQEEKGNGNQ